MTARLHYVVEGPVDAPALVLGNSIGTTTGVWEAQARSLAGQFRVVRFDHRGHGTSQSPPPPWKIADLGADVLALLDDLGIASASYAGLSLGGMVGMWLAAHTPQRIDRLVLVCTSANLKAPDAWRQRAATVRAGGMAAIVDPVVDKWFTTGFPARRPEVVAQYKRMLAQTPAEGYAACCDALADLDLAPDLAEIVAPTLVVSAADDLAIPVAHSEEIAAGIEGARLFVVRDAAHIATVEQPEQITGEIAAHLQVKEA